MKKLVLLLLAIVGLVLWFTLARPAERGGPSLGEAGTRPAGENEARAALAEPTAADSTVRQPAASAVQVPSAPAKGSARGEPAVPFHGLVLDALTQRPVAGARALVPWTRSSDKPDHLPAAEIESEARSDAEGRFELGLASSDSFGEGYLVAAGYGVAAFVIDELHRTRGQALVLELLPTAVLAVHVLDAAGEPVRATVAIVRPPVQSFTAHGVQPGRALAWSELTDESGVARFPELPTEVELFWNVISASEGGSAGRIALEPGGRRSLEVLLGGGARVRGHVRDGQGNAVVALTLSLTRDQGEPNGGVAVAKARSDENGAFEFQGVPFGLLQFGLSSGEDEWVLQGERDLVVDRALLERDLVVAPGLFLQGTVLGTEDEIDELQFVTVRRLDGAWAADGFLQGSGFQAGPLGAGEYLVAAAGSDVATAVVQATAGTSGIELPILRAEELRIRVEGASGAYALHLIDVARGPSWFWTENRPELSRKIAAGKYVLWATAGDLVACAGPIEVPAEAEVVLHLEPGAHCTFVHRALEGRRELRLTVEGRPVPNSLSGAGTAAWLEAGAARSVLLPARALVAELLENERVVARAELAPAPNERLRVVLEPR